MDTPESAEVAFRLDGVGFTWDDGAVALRDIGLTLARGESVAILGGNGSGKTTLLRILDGLVFATTGTVQAFGRPLDEKGLRDPATAHRFRQRVGFVFQNADAQLFSSSVRDELAFGPLQLDLEPAEVERRVADVAAMMGLTSLLDRHPYRLSGGEKRKVALASVMTANPEVVLLDEPTTGLDPRAQVSLVRLLRTLHGAGKTLVMATNDLELVPELATRVVVIDPSHGVAADGPSREVLADTRGLLAANVIHEHSHWHGDRMHTHALPPDRRHEHHD